MDKKSSVLGRFFEGRPIHLVVTSAFFAASLVTMIGLLIWRWQSTPNRGFLIVVMVILGWILCLYWEGHRWVRLLMIVTYLFNGIDMVAGLTRQSHMNIFAGYHGTPTSKVYLWFQLCFSIYMLFWLFSPKAKRYFAPDAIQERKSLAASRK